jgi:hypothetical protein
MARTIQNLAQGRGRCYREGRDRAVSAAFLARKLLREGSEASPPGRVAEPAGP